LVPSLGELVRESWGPAPTSAGIPGEGVYEVKYTNVRTNVVRTPAEWLPGEEA